MEVLRQKGENSDFKAMGSSTTLLNSSACAHNSLQPALMCRKGAFHANGLKPSSAELECTCPQQAISLQRCSAKEFFKPSELERNPVVLKRTRHQQPLAHHDACMEVIQAHVGLSAGLRGSSAVCRTGKNTDLYLNSNQTISYDKSTSSSNFCSKAR
jgi:hypothetical protein